MTSSGDSARRVVVGVSTSESGRAALRAGVDEARRRHAALVLVRAWRDIDRVFSMTSAEVRDLPLSRARENELLDAAVAAARALDGTLAVTGVLVAADVYPALLDAAAGAEVLVVGAGRGPIATWFRAHAPVPVVVAQPATAPTSPPPTPAARSC